MTLPQLVDNGFWPEIQYGDFSSLTVSAFMRNKYLFFFMFKQRDRFYREKNKIQNPGKLSSYHYFMTDVYVGNLALLIMLFVFALFVGKIPTTFPGVFFIFPVLLVQLFFSYLFCFAFLSVIPLCLASFLVYILFFRIRQLSRMRLPMCINIITLVYQD